MIELSASRPYSNAFNLPPPRNPIAGARRQLLLDACAQFPRRRYARVLRLVSVMRRRSSGCARDVRWPGRGSGRRGSAAACGGVRARR